jgi:general nucleoside transport system permease protein
MPTIRKMFTQQAIIGVLTPIIAVILALLTGAVIIVVFITSYYLGDEVLTELAAKDVPAEVLASVAPLRNRQYASRQDFEEGLLQRIESFQLTREALDRVKPGDLPADMRQQLLPLTEEPLTTQSKYLQAIRALIGRDNLLRYRDVLLKAADHHREVRRTIMTTALRRENPVEVYRVVFVEALGDREGWGEVLYRATPLIFTGLAVAFAFQCGLFNIGGEGQMVIGGFVTTWVGFTFVGLPGPLLVPVCILMGGAAGAIWGAVPGFLKAKLGVHEVVNTIMMNWIGVALIQYLTKVYKEPLDMIPQTAAIAEAARLSRLARYFGWLFPSYVHVNTSLFVALGVVVILAYLLKRTKLGYEIRAVGLSPAAAECGGISVAKNTILAMAISGAVAGLVGVNQVMGDKHRFLYEIFEGKGFDGIGVALIGKIIPMASCLGRCSSASWNSADFQPASRAAVAFRAKLS